MRQKLEDPHQNFWQLACIQAAAFSQALDVSQGIAMNHGIPTAILSIVIGNLVLWLVGLATTTMAFANKENATQIAGAYLGKFGAALATLVVTLAFLSWFSIQIEATTESVASIVTWFGTPVFTPVRLGIAFGLITTLLVLGGIKLIRWLSVIFLPLQLAVLVYLAIFSSSPTYPTIGWSFTLAPIISVVSVTLPGFALLPTFFRHSRSRADSMIALSLITIITTAIQITNIWIPLSIFTPATNGSALVSGPVFLFYALCLVYVVSSYLTVNLVNTYFASAGWEAITSGRSGKKELAIMALVGTAVYTITQLQSLLTITEVLTTNYIASLGVVLMVSFAIKIMVQHRPRLIQQRVNLSCWLVGCAFATVTTLELIPHTLPSLIVATMSSILAFLGVIFIEETVWSIKTLAKKRETH